MLHPVKAGTMFAYPDRKKITVTSLDGLGEDNFQEKSFYVEIRDIFAKINYSRCRLHRRWHGALIVAPGTVFAMKRMGHRGKF